MRSEETEERQEEREENRREESKKWETAEMRTEESREEKRKQRREMLITIHNQQKAFTEIRLSQKKSLKARRNYWTNHLPIERESIL